MTENQTKSWERKLVALTPPTSKPTSAKPPLLDVAAAAEYLNVSESYLRTLVRGKRIGHSKIGQYVRFTQDDLDAFVLAGRVEPTA